MLRRRGVPVLAVFTAASLVACDVINAGGGRLLTGLANGGSGAVNRRYLGAVRISQPERTVAVGQTLQLTAIPLDQYDQPLGLTLLTTWSVEAPGIAAVDGNGLVRGVAVGTFVIYARVTQRPAECDPVCEIVHWGFFEGAVVLPPPALSSVAVGTPPGDLILGGTVQLTARPQDQYGNVFPASVTWTSFSPSVATVSGTGLVTGVAVGTATIGASATAGAVTVTTSNVPITVTAPAVVPVLTDVTVGPASSQIEVGAGVQLVATPRDQNLNHLAATVVWSSSAPAIASVNPTTGAVSGLLPGAVTITAHATLGAASAMGSASVRVVARPPDPPRLASFMITGPTTVAAASTITLTAVARDQYGAAWPATVSWASIDPLIATVNAGTGLVTGVAAGSATIRASTIAAGSFVTAERAITVTAASLFPLALNVTANPFNQFNPQFVDIAAGGTVFFIFQSVTHTVQFTPIAGAPPDIAASANVTVSRLFTLPGTYAYQCTIHVGLMYGSVIVH